MKKTALSFAICVAMAIPTVSNALSLGEIQSNSSLNQPFRGKINLLSTNVADARNLRVRVASPDVFNRVGIDRPAFLNNIRFNPTVQNGKPVILVSSNQAIHEPFLNFLLEVSWPNGKLLKEYTVLLDPPVLSSPNTAIASNTAGIRAEPRVQGRISRPAIQPARRVQPPQRVARRAPPRRVVRAAPARRAPARRAPTPRPVASASRVTTYNVRRGDTLSKVAKKLGYSGVRNAQMMMALFQKNRNAFYKNNMNNLKAGARLSRPSAQEAKALSVNSAKSQIITQARDWKKARATTIAKTGTKKATQVASNQQARLEVSGNNNAKASSSNSSGNSSISNLNKKLTMLTESLTTKKNENQELKSRVSELESLLRKKNRLITLKSEQLATLQELVGTTEGQTSNNGEPQIQESIANQREGTDIQTQVENNKANQNGEIIRVENEQNAVLMQNQEPTPVEETQLINQNITEEVVTEVIPEEAAEESTDILGLLSSPLAMGVGGGSLLALLGSLWFMRRRKNNSYEEYDYDSQINIDDAETVSPSFEDSEMNVEDTTTQIDESEFLENDVMRHEHIKNSGLLDDEQEDLLQEADVYIVYGLHDQAESELKQAIAKEPNNLAYRSKLLENYKAAGDKEAFTLEAKAFMDIEAEGKEKYLDDISEWGSTLIPESNLFSGDGLKVAATGAGVAMVAGTALAQETDELDSLVVEDDNLIDNNEDDGLESFDLDSVLEDDTDGDLIGEIDVDPINLDMGNEPLEISSQGLVDLEEEFASNIDEDVESNIDLTDNSFNLNEFDIDSELDALDTSITDLDLTDLDSIEEDNNVESKDDVTDNSLDLTSLNLDIEGDDFDKIMPEDHQYKSTSVELSVDGETDDKEEENLLAEFDDNLSFLDLDNDDAEGIEETHIETKLDLAKAYIDMGDIEGARSTLEEVLQEGSDEQKRIAEELLHQTG